MERLELEIEPRFIEDDYAIEKPPALPTLLWQIMLTAGVKTKPLLLR